MPTPKTNALWIPTIALLTLALGWIGGRIGSASVGTDGSADIDLSGELRALANAQERTALVLERLEEALLDLEVAQPVPAFTREQIEEAGARPAIDGESVDALNHTLEAIRMTFERELGATQELIREAPAFGGESLTNVRDRKRETDWIALDDLEKSWRLDEQAADRSQYFQTPRDLLEAYGPPTAIYRPKGGLLFHYRHHPEGAPGPSHYFRIQDGIVVEFFIEDETGEEDSGI